jgi:hypothetical protein
MGNFTSLYPDIILGSSSSLKKEDIGERYVKLKDFLLIYGIEHTYAHFILLGNKYFKEIKHRHMEINVLIFYEKCTELYKDKKKYKPIDYFENDEEIFFSKKEKYNDKYSCLKECDRLYFLLSNPHAIRAIEELNKEKEEKNNPYEKLFDQICKLFIINYLEKHI